MIQLLKQLISWFKNEKTKFFSKKIRKKILKISYKSQTTHIASSLSIVDLITVIYLKFMNKKRNTFILSKGHACLAHYCLLNELKIISNKDLETYGKNNSALMCHSDFKVPGVEVSTGSLGHGLPIATGIALSYKLKKENKKVFVLMSDGELNEGSNWESILFASHHKINNLVLIIDYNKIQSLDFVKKTINLEPLDKKFKAFGFDTIKINGHNYSKIFLALKKESKRPKVIIADTIKGKGVSFMENKVLWHYKPPNKEEFKKAIVELN